MRILWFATLLLLVGCAPYKTCPQYEEDDHWLYNVVPRHRSQIRWYDVGHWCTWALLGNDDDGLFGENPPTVANAFKWGLRNPLHNFCFYVAGTAYWDNSEFTLLSVSDNGLRLCDYSPEAGTVFPSKNSGFFLGFHGWKPFVSLRLAYTDDCKSDFYLGWRERGNFGVKVLPLAMKRDKREGPYDPDMLPCY